MARFLLLVFCFVISSAAVAEQDQAVETIDADRVALVIGNGSYDNINDQLRNPANDAKAIATKLRALDIEVIEATDLDYRGMREALRKFDRALQHADAGLFFYAGHGMEYRGRNYLFPTDVILETEGDIGLSLIDIEQVLQVMETAVPTRLIFLDACRNNPLTSRFGRTLAGARAMTASQGLGRIDASVGTFIAYATAPGEIAVDGIGRNSPFTTALLLYLDEPGLEVSQLMHKVRNSVIEATNEKQIPWESSSLRGPFVLNRDKTADISTVAAASATDEGNRRVEKLFWDSIKDHDRSASYETYLELFGEEGLFAPLALARIKSGGREQPEQIEATLVFDREVVQKNLSALGYYDGDANGRFDAQTRLAIQRWQEENGDADTGFLAAGQIDLLATEASSVLAALDTAREEFFDEQPSELLKPSGAVASTPAETWPAGRPDRFDDLISDQSAEGILDAYAERTDVSELEESAGNGDTKAAVLAGLSYVVGRNVDQNHRKARVLLEQGCDEGITRSCHSLGILYENGLGVDQDYGKAKELFDRSCESGVARSCNRLGHLYQSALGTTQDYTKAQTFYQRACNAEHQEGCAGLGNLYEEGLGVDQDYPKAREFFKRGYEGDNSRACTKLGYHYDMGLGVNQDYAEARVHYRKGCEGRDPDACTNLGYHYDLGLGVGRDHAGAKELYQKGCDGGSGSGCTNLGYLYDGGLGVDPDYAKARMLYEKGCNLGHPRACSNLGNLYEGGLGVDQDYAKARAYYDEGCRRGHATGCNNLGNLYSEGLGVDVNVVRARELYREACDLQEVRFCEKLLQ